MNKIFAALPALILLVFSQLPVSSQSKLPDNYFLTKLDNGLEVLVLEDKSVPLVTVEINVRNGSYTEPAEFSGLSHFYEHMFFKANKDIPSQEQYLKRTDELGMAWNGTTSVNRVNYFFTLPSRNFDDGLKFMNSAIRYPLFLQEEMNKEHAVVNGEFQRNESNPEFHLWHEMGLKMWGSDFTRKNPIGDHEIILSATTEKMHAIQHKYYWPNNSLLIVAGDVSHNEVFEKVKNVYGDWQPSGFDPFKKWPVPEFKPLTDNITYVTLNDNAKNPVIAMGWEGPDTRKDIKGTFTADLFSTIIGLETSKMQKDLVDGGLAQQVSLGYSTDKYTGPIQLRVVPNPQKVKECIAKVKEEINQWDSDSYFTDEELQTAKDKLAIQETYQKEQTSGYVHTIGFWWAVADIDYCINYINNINKVTREDIKKYVNKYIKDQPNISGILISPAMQQTMGIKSYDDLNN